MPQEDPSAEGQRVVSDSLGMETVLRSITIPDGVATITADLGLPSARTLALELCGSRRDTTGVIIGRVRDAGADTARGGARVAATWGELVIDARSVRNAAAEISTVTGADGRFVLCGVPTDIAVLLQARTSAADTNQLTSGIDVSFPSGVPLVHRDLLAAAGTERRTRINGRVRRPDGTPLVGARVRIRGESTTTVTYTAGTFVLTDAPAGTRTLEAIAMGFAPTRIPVDVRVAGTSAAEIVMRTTLTTLEADDVDRFVSVASLGGIEVYSQPNEVPSELMRGLSISAAQRRYPSSPSCCATDSRSTTC